MEYGSVGEEYAEFTAAELEADIRELPGQCFDSLDRRALRGVEEC